MWQSFVITDFERNMKGSRIVSNNQVVPYKVVPVIVMSSPQTKIIFFWLKFLEGFLGEGNRELMMLIHRIPSLPKGVL